MQEKDSYYDALLTHRLQTKKRVHLASKALFERIPSDLSALLA